MRSLLTILRTAGALWPYYAGIVVASILTAMTALISPFIVKSATDTVVDALGGADRTGLTTTIVWLAVALLAAELASTIIHNIGGFLGDAMAARMRQILSTRYFAKLLALPQRYFDQQVTGTIISRLDRSITSITQFLQTFANSFFPMLVTVFAVLGITSYYFWPLAVLLALIFPAYMWLTTLTSKRWQLYEKDINDHIDTAGGRFAEVIGQVKVVKSFVAEVRELAGFAGHYADTIALTRLQSRWWHLMDTLRGGVLNLVFFGIYLVLFTRTLDGHLTIGEMVMLIQLVTMARQPAMMMSFLVDNAQRAVAGSRSYFQVMAEVDEKHAPAPLRAAVVADGAVPAVTNDAGGTTFSPTDLTEGCATVDFSGVTFGYDDDRPIVHDITFSARQGEKVAFVGESGGGKSTLVNLLLGLYRPQAGRLTICGRDVAELPAAEVRAAVGVVFQEPSLFSGTVRENIAYGRPDATDAEIVEAARRSHAHEFIAGFADGYDTLIGERGLRLSGGQKQRIAVARAMLKDAPVLVLDEATSALDSKAERAVQAGLEELMIGRTTLVIAHRLSTIANVDTIVTLREGRIDEIGPPAVLAASGGIYAELLALTASSSAADRRRLRDFGFSGDAGAVESEDGVAIPRRS